MSACQFVLFFRNIIYFFYKNSHKLAQVNIVNSIKFKQRVMFLSKVSYLQFWNTCTVRQFKKMFSFFRITCSISINLSTIFLKGEKLWNSESTTWHTISFFFFKWRLMSSTREIIVKWLKYTDNFEKKANLRSFDAIYAYIFLANLYRYNFFHCIIISAYNNTYQKET